MKKVMALLAAVIVLAGSVEMMASAATTATCHHPSIQIEEGNNSIETYTHSIQVGTSTSGKPILAACLVEIKWHNYKITCLVCGEVMLRKEKIYENHSMH